MAQSFIHVRFPRQQGLEVAVVLRRVGRFYRLHWVGGAGDELSGDTDCYKLLTVFGNGSADNPICLED